MRGQLYEPEYRPRLSGHETFPLRYGWLKKAYDAVEGAVCSDTNAPSSPTPARSRISVSERTWSARCGIGRLRPASSARTHA